MKVYFDNAATTRVRDEVVDEISLLYFFYGLPGIWFFYKTKTVKKA